MSYSIKEKPTLVFSDQDMSYSIKEKEPRANTGLLRSGYVIPIQH